jgi:hypothetical protein
VAKFSRKKTKIQKVLNTGLLSSFETICNAHSFLQKTNSFLPIPTSKTGGTLVAKFQPAKKEAPLSPNSNQRKRRHPCCQFQQTKQNKTASFQLQEAKHLHVPCQFQQANRHGTKVCLELTVRRVSLAASVASETLTPAAVAVSFAASAACPVWYWIFSPTSPANHPTNPKKKKNTQSSQKHPFSLLAELDHDS